MDEGDDLLDLLGVTLPPPVSKKAAICSEPKTKRFTDWSDGNRFEFGGYLAKTVVHICSTCEGRTEILVGLFVEEIHHTKARKLTQLNRGSQWPMGVEHRCEVTEQAVDVCAKCVRDLGFSQVVDGRGQPYTLVVKE